MENIDSSITKIYEKQQTMSGTEEDALEYLQVLERHKDLNVVIEEQIETPIKLSTKSWDKIVSLMPEEKKYSLAFLCFSLIDEIEENEIWGIRKNPQTGEETVLQDVFFNTVLEASAPHDVPFVMCDDDFSQFTDYFNQIENEPKNRAIKVSEDLAKAEQKIVPKKEEKKEEDEDQGYEIKKEIIEDKNGVTRVVTTKVKKTTNTVYEPNVVEDTSNHVEKIEQDIQKEIEEEKKREEKMKPTTEIVISKPREELTKDLIKSEFEGEPITIATRKITISKDGEEQVFEEEEVPSEEKNI